MDGSDGSGSPLYLLTELSAITRYNYVSLSLAKIPKLLPLRLGHTYGSCSFQIHLMR